MAEVKADRHVWHGTEQEPTLDCIQFGGRKADSFRRTKRRMLVFTKRGRRRRPHKDVTAYPSKRIFMDRLEIIAVNAFQDLTRNKFNSDSEESIFYHPYYELEGLPSRMGHDAAFQRIVELNFNVIRRGNSARWETDEVLEYLAFVVGIMRSVYSCARVAVNYDTAHNSATVKRHCRINVTYVVDSQVPEEVNINKLASFLRTNAYFNITNSIGNGVRDEVLLLGV
jgi:hypothetical protein